MAFFSTDKASNGGNQKGYTPAQKKQVAAKTREVKRLEKEVNARKKQGG